MDRRELAELVHADLEAILARTRDAYVERVPRLRELPAPLVEDVVEATRRGVRQFLRYYVEGSLDGESWRLVRDATMERAGEVFSQDEIREFIATARATTAEAVHHLGELHPDLPAVDRQQVAAAMDRYLAELALQEDALRQLTPSRDIDLVLAQLEADGADLQ